MNTDALSNPEAEWSVAASLVQKPGMIAEVVGTQLEAQDFLREDARALYGTTVQSYYADMPVEPLTIAELLRQDFASLWEIPEQRVGTALIERISRRNMGANVLEHAAIIKRLSTARQLLGVIDDAVAAIGEGQQTPEQVAATMSAEALALTSGTIRRAELLSWMDTGTAYAKYLRRQRIARRQGIELAVYTGFPFIDKYTRGIAPTELCVIAGAPGVGKSVLGWKAAEGFASRQMTKPAQHRVSTLVVSMEMGLIPSSTRLAQSITHIDGMRLREGEVSDREYQHVLREWKNRDGLPIYFNYASSFRLSQLRALVVEAIRQHNVGFVVLDHFRQIDTDKAIRDPNDRDEIKVRFLKESICKDLNIAMLCLAHTSKFGRAAEGNPAPKLADLRGSGQIAANADFVGLMHKPAKNASEAEQIAMGLQDEDAELHWAKARHTAEGPAEFVFQPSTMTIRSK